MFAETCPGKLARPFKVPSGRKLERPSEVPAGFFVVVFVFGFGSPAQSAACRTVCVSLLRAGSSQETNARCGPTPSLRC